MSRGPSILLVTDPAYEDDAILEAIEAVSSEIPAGELGVQLRDRVRDRSVVSRFAARLRALTREKGAWLIVNSDAPMAKECGADGVHLGGHAITIAEAREICGADAWISVAAHSDGAVRAALKEGANAALVSPIFPTAPASEMRVRVRPAPGSREMGPKVPRGLQALESARAVAPSPFLLYALGGVSSANARSCIDAGADGVALIRGLLASPDPAGEAKAVWKAVAR